MEFEICRLMEAIGKSVSEAQQNLEDHSMQRFLSYFEPVSDRIHEQSVQRAVKPLTAQIIIPSDEDLSKTTVAEIPLVTLASHMQVHLNQVTIKVRTNFLMDESETVKVDLNKSFSNGIDSSVNSKSDNSESGMIEMVFQISEKPEGEARVVQNIERLI